MKDQFVTETFSNLKLSKEKKQQFYKNLIKLSGLEQTQSCLEPISNLTPSQQCKLSVKVSFGR